VNAGEKSSSFQGDLVMFRIQIGFLFIFGCSTVLLAGAGGPTPPKAEARHECVRVTMEKFELGNGKEIIRAV
jgi:hypothetical protein